MNKVKPKSPLAPLFQRGEQHRAASAFPFVNTLASRFEDEGLRGNHCRPVRTPRLASPFEKGGLRGICSCAIFPPLNAVQAA